VKGFGLEQGMVKEKDWNSRGTRIFGSAMNKILVLQQVVLDQLVSTENTTDTNRNLQLRSKPRYCEVFILTLSLYSAIL
jgi:hypothetical protein